MLDVGIKSPVFMKFRGLLILALLLCAGFLAPPPARAEEMPKPSGNFRSTDLPLPRYVSLRSDMVYVRAGPDLRYPIKWIFRREGMPVEIVQEFEHWRKIKAIDGGEGWVHQSMLSGERKVLIKSESDPVPLREGFTKNARMIARIEPMVVAGVDKCDSGWCRIEASGYRGWVERNFLWGIYDDEELN